MTLTTEQAIEELNDMLAFEIDEFGEVPETEEAVYMAINALKERKTGGWNVITKSPMDADEIAAWCEHLGYEIPSDEAYMYGNLPDEGEDVLVCTRTGTVFIDSLCCDEGCYFEDYGEMDGIVAWMPLPEPYKEVDE